MKLGTETGSLTNHLYSRMVVGQPEPAVGMAATLLSWTDRHAATIIDVIDRGRNGTYLVVRQDIAVRTDGLGRSESQTHEFRPNPTGHVSIFRQNIKGTWEEVTLRVGKDGRERYAKAAGGYGLRIGEREEYRDPCF